MKKLITGAVAALALLFGFASCSGDLHDEEMPKHEPVTIDGAAWYVYDLTVFGDNDGKTGKFILNNNNNGSQTVDSLMPEFTAKTGAVVFFTADATKKNDDKYELLTSYQTDNPTYTAKPGTVRFYIYTNETNPTFYCFGNDGAFVGSPAWPGSPMSKLGEAAATEYKMTLKKVIVKNLPAELNGQTVGYRGGLVDSSWNFKSENSGVITNGTVEVPVNKEYVVSSNTGYASTSEFKIADANWGTSIGKGFGSDNDAANVSLLLVDGATVNIIGYYVETNTERTDKYSCVWYLEKAE
mgnify:CR=1 FL=1